MSSAATKSRMMHGYQKRLSLARVLVACRLDLLELLHKEGQLSIPGDLALNRAFVFLTVGKQSKNLHKRRIQSVINRRPIHEGRAWDF